MRVRLQVCITFYLRGMRNIKCQRKVLLRMGNYKELQNTTLREQTKKLIDWFIVNNLNRKMCWLIRINASLILLLIVSQQYIMKSRVSFFFFSLLISPVSLRMGLGLSEVSLMLSVLVFASGGVECLSKQLGSESLGCSNYLFHWVF